MTQHVPPRGSTPKPQSQQAAARPAPDKVADDASASRPGAMRSIPLSTPQKIVPPEPKPSTMTTSSIPRPQKPVGVESDARQMFATSRVRLRQSADTTAAVVTTLERGQNVKTISTKGKWRQVSVSGKQGWVHGDFLSEERPAETEIVAAQRPKVPVTPRKTPAAEQTAPRPQLASTRQTAEISDGWGGLRPARAPQGGDCQCPYDLMLSGKQCGERSAYSRQIGKPQCYF